MTHEHTAQKQPAINDPEPVDLTHNASIVFYITFSIAFVSAGKINIEQ
jgi:hypothetical protein